MPLPRLPAERHLLAFRSFRAPMKYTVFQRLSVPVTLLFLTMVALNTRGDFFSWKENVSGNFTDPSRWLGPTTPNTRIPGAGDDISLGKSPSTTFTVTIAGDQATRELVNDQLILNILGSYTVQKIFGFGSPLTITGGGTMNVTLWQIGAQGIVDGAKARIGTFQPFACGLASELILRNGAEVESQDWLMDRGCLKAIVEEGAVWKHMKEVPAGNQVVIGANGRVELPSTDLLLLIAEGTGAQMRVGGRFRGWGRVANGARIDCAEGLLEGPASMVLSNGTWAIQGAFTHKSDRLMIQAEAN